MSADDPPLTDPLSKDATRPPRQQARSLFQVPPALKRIFDRFPLVAHAENELPLRAPSRARDEHVLYIFATTNDVKNGRPSFNPACLKWQTYLRLSGIPHRTFASNNHASPSGALPFLLPSVDGEAPPSPVPSSKLKRYVDAQQGQKKRTQQVEPADVRYEAYQSLIETNIRAAWLYQLYLNPVNSAVLRRLYVAPCSSNALAQMVIAHQLQQAAQNEIVKTTGSSTIAERDLLRGAEDALASLSALLGGNRWFFAQQAPGLFDAAVFAYTYLLLDDEMGWQENGLGERLQKFENLVQHRNRIAELYY